MRVSGFKWGVSLALTVMLSACGGGGSDDSATTTNPPPVNPPAVPTLTSQRVFPNMSFARPPVMMLQAPNDTSRWFVVQQDGHIFSFANTANVSAKTTVADLSEENGGPVVFRNVHGLLGMAFHPSFPADRRVYLGYTHEVDAANDIIAMRLSQFTISADGNTIDPASERIIFEMEQPGGHDNGGNVMFGPDGYLYFTPGDGGRDDNGGAQVGSGQTMTTILGKMIRINVGTADPGTGRPPYTIPSDNPFPAGAQCRMDGTSPTGEKCPEIYASGFRNPWRWSFDRAGTHDLWAADVGAKAREEVDKVVKGGNYGWRCVEGTHVTSFNCGSEPQGDFKPPVAEYAHATDGTLGLGVAVIGGYIYRGSAMPGLVGRYVFGDEATGNIWTIATNESNTQLITASTPVYASGLMVVSFAEDPASGELYFVDRGKSDEVGSTVRAPGIYKIVAAN